MTEKQPPQKFGSIASQTGGLKIGGKSKNEEKKPQDKQKSDKGPRKQHTIYLPAALSKWLKLQAIEEEREMSDIVADALELYKIRPGGSQPNE